MLGVTSQSKVSISFAQTSISLGSWFCIVVVGRREGQAGPANATPTDGVSAFKWKPNSPLYSEVE